MIEDEVSAREYCRERTDAIGFAKLQKLVHHLEAESTRQNLVARSSMQQVWRRHIADSLQLLEHVPRETGLWVDLGSGAGFPGLVVAVAEPQRQIVLIEARRLRTVWLETVSSTLGLENVRVEAARVEDVQGRDATVISARAFAPLGKLLKLSTRFSTPETVWVLPKGRSAGQELDEQPETIRAMFHVEQSLTDADAGILVGRGVPELR